MSDTVSGKKVVVILGMHRSGTSAISRGLQVMGVELGDRLMPPNQDVNAKGFWEDIDINALNIEMLYALGSDWHHLAPIDSADTETLHKQGFFLRAVNLMQQKIGDAPVFGFKDPRTAKLLPFWKEVFSHCRFDVHYVLTVRHPLSVARSLEKRDDLDAVKSYFLWLEHVVSSLTGTIDSNRVIVDYDLLMRSVEHELGRIAKQLDLSIDPVALQTYKAEFIDAGLRHSVYDLNDLLLDKACPLLVREVYETLLGVASEAAEDDALLQGKVELWAREFERIVPILGLVDRLTTQNAAHGWNVTELNDQAAELNEQVAELTDETVRRGMWALSLDGQLKEAQASIAQITSSNSWRITLPLREIRRLINTPLPQAKRYLKGTVRFGRVVYNRLPLSTKTSITLRRLIAKYAPWLLRVSKDQPVSVPTSQQSMVTVLPLTDLNAAADGVKLATSSQPLVSIIIPVYGQCEYTLRCLLSIAANQPSIPYEVIVIDDCSPDDSVEILQRVSDILLIHNPVNQGFIRSCNLGVKAAKGQYVYFLNNDTQVTAGWLDELVRTFNEFPGTGLAGSKLVYPNGMLQEAGGIIWRNGNAWNFGRNQDPSLPVYNYAREVDYCSGASIMVPKKLFEELGGFDEHYLPAYCEDADLALKIRDLGYRVIYQPLSVVVHFEGVTSGTDTTQGVKAYQVENLKKLYERWNSRLQTHQPAGMEIDNAKDRRATRRILVIDHCTPIPTHDAGSILIFNLLLLLREMDFQVTFIPEDNFLYMEEHTMALQRAGIEVLYAPYITNVEDHLKEFGRRYDIALLVRPVVVERQIRAIRRYCPKVKVLFHTVDLHFLRMSREATLQSDRVKQTAALKMKLRELSAIRASDVSIVVSTAELELLHPELPDAKLHVFPLIMDVSGTSKTFSKRRDIVFVGGFQHTPNIDAVCYFVGEIMPILRTRLQGVRFHVVGSNATPEIYALAAEDVAIVGFVEDLNPLLDQMRVSVAPLRFGAGIKGKIASAMVVGLPTVATSMASEGMSLMDGKNILVADGAKDFAEAVIRLYEDESLWSSISEASIKFADSAWGAEAAWKILAMILAEMGVETKRDDRPLMLYSTRG